jgi:hypothetical protein
VKLIATDITRREMLELPDALANYRLANRSEPIDPDAFEIADAARPTFGFRLIGGTGVGGGLQSVVQTLGWAAEVGADIFHTATDAWDKHFLSTSTVVRAPAPSRPAPSAKPTSPRQRPKAMAAQLRPSSRQPHHRPPHSSLIADARIRHGRALGTGEAGFNPKTGKKTE